MARYRRKPVVVDAFRLRPEFQEARPVWWMEPYRPPGADDDAFFGGFDGRCWYRLMEREAYWILTRHGPVIAEFGDWIIRGVDGEVYPCKDETFVKIYELAEED